MRINVNQFKNIPESLLFSVNNDDGDDALMFFFFAFDEI